MSFLSSLRTCSFLKKSTKKKNQKKKKKKKKKTKKICEGERIDLC